MRAKQGWAVVAALSVATLAAAADVFLDYGLDRQEWTDAFVNSITGGSLYSPPVPAKLKALAPAQRAAVVTALGSAAKAFFNTPEFKAQYAREYEAQRPDDLKPPRTAKQIADDMRADMDKGVREMEASLKSMPPEVRKQAESALATARAAIQAQMAQVDRAAAEQAAEEKRRYDEAKSRPPDPDALSPDPKVSLQRSLRAFLEETAGVDYSAALKTEFGFRKFVREDYESKPRAWKKCFRAGREACDAARAFATSWLAELK